jgi:hypothetical protein
MSIPAAVDTILTGEPPDPLIKAGRYQIIPDGADKTKAHTRVTNFSEKLSDQYTLTLWKERMVLIGAAHRSDITVAALAAGDDAKELNRLAEAAKEAAKANAARDTGSALHKLCECVDAGEELTLPEPWQSDIEAYITCLADLGATVEEIEQVVVCPKLGLAGRFDRTVLIGDERYIMDVKTGRDLSYSWGSIAIQLALYAGAETIYDPETKRHRRMPEVNQERALVFHLRASTATCTPYWINLEDGRRGIALVSELLEWRKRTRGIVTTATIPRFSAHAEVREYTKKRCQYVIDGGHGAELARAWPDDVATLKANEDHSEAELDAILDACDTIEARHKMAFPEFTDPRGLEKF